MRGEGETSHFRAHNISFLAGANSKQRQLSSVSFFHPDTLTFPSHPELSPSPPSTVRETFFREGSSPQVGTFHFCTFTACPPSTSWLRAESHRFLGPRELSLAEPQGTKRPPLQCP